ncbi:hypothetical protein EDB85DRAFT_2141826 [Lactarius pseudohatsudake]|nr:hypothetical protein EDB85DRAFT_2141826 [Lactarius pseudohatsudake]
MRKPTREPHLSTPPANASRLRLTRPVTHRRLTALASAPSQGELAAQHLLKVVRSDASGTCATAQRRGPYTAGTPSSLSGNVLHDRRGRITHKPGPLSLDELGSDFEEDSDALMPRLTTTITAPRQAAMVASGSALTEAGTEEQLDESKAMKDLNAHIKQLTNLILTSQTVDENRGDESHPASPSKVDFDMTPYQILVLEAALQARPELPPNAPESEKDHLLGEQARNIRELEMVIKGYEDNLGAPLRAMREDVEREWGARAQVDDLSN